MKETRIRKAQKDELEMETLTPEEMAEIREVEEENVWIPFQDVKAYFRVKDAVEGKAIKG